MDKFSESIKVLNDYRNLYHAETTSTEQYKVANAINDILPEFCRLIESDAEPVVHGHWERHYCFTDICNKEHIYGYHCSNCGKGWIEAQPERNNYCGWCGAKMDEEQECEI